MKSFLIYRPHIISLCFLKKYGFLGIKKAYKYAKKALPNTYPKKSKMLNIYSVYQQLKAYMSEIYQDATTAGGGDSETPTS